MTRSILWLLIAVVLAAAAAVVLPLLRTGSGDEPGPAGLAGRAAPVFTLKDDTGAAVSLAQYRGDVVVMNLWASWCPPCRAEMPDLQRLQDRYRGRGVVVVGVDQGESPERARTFASSLGIRFPIWIDARQAYGRLYAALGLPTTVLVARNGRVIHGFDGALTFGQMQAAVAAAVHTR